MMRTALIYHDNKDHTTYFMGSIAQAPGISASVLWDKLGLDRQAFCKTFDLSIFPDRSICAVDMDESRIDTLEPMDSMPDTCLVIETPKGLRRIEIPDIGDISAALRMRDYDLWYNLRLRDVVRVTPESYCPEFECDDFYEDRYAIRVDTNAKFESYNTFGSFQKALEVAKRLHDTRPNCICNAKSHVLIIRNRLYAGRTEGSEIIWRDGIFLDA